MSIYQKIAKAGPRFFGKARVFKYGFNWSPMYSRSTGKITEVSEDLMSVKIKIPLSWKNRNYANSIYGGSLFSAVDPIPMVQLLNLIGDDYVVWDKYAEISFRRPAKETVYGEFAYSMEELQEIKDRVATENEIEIIKTTRLTDKAQSKVFCEVKKTVYVADKAFYKNKRKLKEAKTK
ncbi:MAG: DUF4442 domain-containing protein [Bacteroidota bacterium]